MRTALTVVLLLALLAAQAVAQDVFQEGQTITVELMNGDKLTGKLEDADGARLVILHDILGRLEIARASRSRAPRSSRLRRRLRPRRRPRPGRASSTWP